MIRITGPFPKWLYRVSPILTFSSGIVMGLNGKDLTGFLVGPIPMGVFLFLSFISLGFLNGAIREMND